MRLARLDGDIINPPLQAPFASPSVVAAVDERVHSNRAKLVEVGCKPEAVVIGSRLATHADGVATGTVGASIGIYQDD